MYFSHYGFQIRSYFISIIFVIFYVYLEVEFIKSTLNKTEKLQRHEQSF